LSNIVAAVGKMGFEKTGQTGEKTRSQVGGSVAQKNNFGGKEPRVIAQPAGSRMNSGRRLVFARALL